MSEEDADSQAAAILAAVKQVQHALPALPPKPPLPGLPVSSSPAERTLKVPPSLGSCRKPPPVEQPPQSRQPPDSQVTAVPAAEQPARKASQMEPEPLALPGSPGKSSPAQLSLKGPPLPDSSAKPSQAEKNLEEPSPWGSPVKPSLPRQSPQPEQVGSIPSLAVRRVFEEPKPLERPLPLSFTMLLKIASVSLGMTPFETERAADRLHASALITYPRTESSCYSEDEEGELTDIVQSIARANLSFLGRPNTAHSIQAYAVRLLQHGPSRPRTDGEATLDHGPISPVPFEDRWPPWRSPGDDAALQLYELVLRYFLAVLSPDFVMMVHTAELSPTQPLEFPLEGTFWVQCRRVLQRGWIEILPVEKVLVAESNPGPAAMKVLSPGCKVSVLGACTEHEPEHQRRTLTMARLVDRMEAHGIGTDASIPKHLQTLVDREYITLLRRRRPPDLPGPEADNSWWVWRALQDGEFDIEEFWRMPGWSDVILELCVTRVGEAIVSWFWEQNRDLVLPSVRAEVERECRAVAYSGSSALSALSLNIEKFRGWYRAVSEALNQDGPRSPGGGLISALRRIQERLPRRLAKELAAVDLSALAERRTAAMMQHRTSDEGDTGP